MWEQLHAEFTDAQIVEIGLVVGLFAGGQRWIHTLDIKHGDDVGTTSKVGYRPDLADESKVRRDHHH
jgi:hypothetical protein